nr:MBL fold metallo-hydrolase [uncultured Undibacterium sp.]
MKFVLFFLGIFYSSMSLAKFEKILVTQLSSDAYVLKSVDYGTNIGLFKTTKGVVLLDPMPGKENLDALSDVVRNLVGKPVSFILNTHEHDDHTGGNAYFVQSGAVLIKDLASFTEINAASAKSHTPEDKVFFHKESNSIFVGDIYDSSWHPTFYAGGVSGFNNAIESILKLGDDQSIVVPGHGKPTSKAKLRVFWRSTLEWVSKVKKLKDDGKTAQEMKDDAELKAILEKFNVENRAPFIPEKALVRFIERTFALIEKSS